MFAAWGTWVARHRWPVLVIALAAVIGAGVWGMGVFGQLSEGGYNDPNSESSQAADVVRTALGARNADIVVIYTPTAGTIDNPALAQRVQQRLAALPHDAVTATDSYWVGDKPQYATADKSRAVAVLTLAGQNDSDKLTAFKKISGKLEVEGAADQVAGAAALGEASASLSTKDLGFAEAVSLPIVLILLLFIFGSLVAAALPVLVGGAAVLGSLGVLHAVALGHDVNSFAVNVASLLGLGMAIDYGLFIVGRFREEQGFGRTTAEAVSRAVATAGRTVVFSATLLMIALAGLLLFPQGFLKSLAYGGLAAVALAAFLSLTLLPAVLAVLGPRVDKLPVKLPVRRNARPAGTGWARFSDRVLNRPVLFALPILAGLLLLAAPIKGVQFGENDERVLPESQPARQAIETLKTDFPSLSSAGVQVVLRGTHGTAPDAAAGDSFATTVGRIAGVAAVTPAGTGGDVLVLTATLKDHDAFSTQARDAVDKIRALTPPPGTEVLVGGATARNVDSLDATAGRLPLMISLLVGATLLLMFLAFGSILLPIKAVVVSALSLSATFGILVWIFQDGHGAGLLQVTPAPLEVGIVVLMGAVVFGLSTDYEVFLLSRMVEARTRGASTAEAVTTGLARTGRVISAAAILLIVVTGAFALSSVSTMRFVGVGMIIALFLDATVVRMLLVPAILKLMGNAAWWAPGPLRRLQERAGLAEYAGEELFPTISVGRHAAPESAAARPSSSPGTPPRHATRPTAAAIASSAAVPALTSAGPGEVGTHWAAAAAAIGRSSPQTVTASVSATGQVSSARVNRHAIPAAAEERQSLRISTGEHAPLRSGTGERPLARSGVGEQSLARNRTGESPLTRSGTGENRPAHNDAGENPWIRNGTSENAATRNDTGDYPPTRSSTGDYPLARNDTDDNPPTQNGTGDYPLTRNDTGENPPARHDAGEDPWIRNGTGESSPSRDDTGDSPWIRNGTGENTPARNGTSEKPPTRDDTGESLPLRNATGENSQARNGIGENPLLRNGTGENPRVRVETGDSPVRFGAAGNPPVRIGAGKQAAWDSRSGQGPTVRVATGEQPPIRLGTGEQSPNSADTGQQPSSRADTGWQPSAPVGVGEQPGAPADGATLRAGSAGRQGFDGQQVPTTGTGLPARAPFGTGERPQVLSLQSSGSPTDDLPASRDDDEISAAPWATRAAEPTDAATPASPADDAASASAKPEMESLETVNLGPLVQPGAGEGHETEPGPETTAILDLGPTADLAAHFEPPEESRPER